MISTCFCIDWVSKLGRETAFDDAAACLPRAEMPVRWYFWTTEPGRFLRAKFGQNTPPCAGWLPWMIPNLRILLTLACMGLHLFSPRGSDRPASQAPKSRRAPCSAVPQARDRFCSNLHSMIDLCVFETIVAKTERWRIDASRSVGSELRGYPPSFSNHPPPRQKGPYWCRI